MFRVNDDGSSIILLWKTVFGTVKQLVCASQNNLGRTYTFEPDILDQLIDNPLCLHHAIKFTPSKISMSCSAPWLLALGDPSITLSDKIDTP
jgi:hypothetical protein